LHWPRQTLLYEPFEKKCGCKVVVEVGLVADRLARLDARKANPNVDVVALTDAAAHEAIQKGLVEKLDFGKLKNHGDLFGFARDPLGGAMAVGYTFYSTSIVYRSDKIAKVTSWKDLFRPELKGRVSLPAINTSQAPLTLMMIEKALGGSSAHFGTAIDEVGKNKAAFPTFYTGGAQLVQLFQQEEIFAAPVGRFSWANLSRLGLPLAWAKPAEGETGGVNVLFLVKGTKQSELAHEFIDFWLSPEVQAALGQAQVDSPVNRKAKLTGAAAQTMSDGSDIAASLVLLPPATAATQRDAWLKDWNARVAK
jgi:putative spermidine/putrescine transport system substrate-binding protein